ncbi:MAG: BatA domain-containing protein [Bacteroidetes bacterium]|nr:BatA domain-containing protein [Bacteroidota bacterium]
MKFVNPYFLFALLLIAIPIIVHLFNFRKFKRVYFTNVKFLLELKQVTKKKSKLKHLLVLISRILVIIFLVLSFAQPFIPIDGSKVRKGQNYVSIYLDNSFSMNAVSANGSLLQDAKNKALEIVSTYKNTDRFQLLTNDFEGKHQRFFSKEEFVEMLKEIDVSSSFKSLSQIISRQKDLMNTENGENKFAYIISDFQKNIVDLNKVKSDTSLNSFLVQLKAVKNTNLFIDSCWFESPVKQLNQLLKMKVRIVNNSDKEVEKSPLKLLINGKQKAIASFDVAANSQTEITIPFTVKEPGIQNCVLEIIDFPVTFDDKYFLSFSVTNKTPILLINGETENSSIKSLFKGDSSFALQSTFDRNIDYAVLTKSKLVVLSDVKNISSGMSTEIQKFVSNGGSLAIFPAANSDLDSYRKFLQNLNSNYFTGLDTVNTKVSQININHPVYKDVFENIPENIDLPSVFSHFEISKSNQSGEEPLMKLRNGSSFICSNSFGKGKVYISAVPLSETFSNLTKHALFVPTMFNIALLSEPQQKLFYFISNEELIDVGSIDISGEKVLKITNSAINFEIIPEIIKNNINSSINTHNQIKEAQNYLLSNGNQQLMGLSFNYLRAESDLKCLSSDEIIKSIETQGLKNFKLISIENKSLSQELQELNQGIRLWKIFIILALIFLAIEIFLLRFFKS